MNKNNIREYKEDDNTIIFNSQSDNKIFSNMFPCQLEYNGNKYNSSEHLFQSLKFTDNENIFKLMLTCKNSFEAKKEATKYKQYINKDYITDMNNNMLIALQAKYNQFPAFKKALNYTKDKDLVEYCYWMKEGAAPSYWGTSYNADKQVYEGYNATGRLLMKVRRDNN